MWHTAGHLETIVTEVEEPESLDLLGIITGLIRTGFDLIAEDALAVLGRTNPLGAFARYFAQMALAEIIDSTEDTVSANARIDAHNQTVFDLIGLSTRVTNAWTQAIDNASNRLNSEESRREFLDWVIESDDPEESLAQVASAQSLLRTPSVEFYQVEMVSAWLRLHHRVENEDDPGEQVDYGVVRVDLVIDGDDQVQLDRCIIVSPSAFQVREAIRVTGRGVIPLETNAHRVVHLHNPNTGVAMWTAPLDPDQRTLPRAVRSYRERALSVLAEEIPIDLCEIQESSRRVGGAED